MRGKREEGGRSGWWTGGGWIGQEFETYTSNTFISSVLSSYPPPSPPPQPTTHPSPLTSLPPADLPWHNETQSSDGCVVAIENSSFERDVSRDSPLVEVSRSAAY